MAGNKSGGLKKRTPTPYLLLAPSIILFTVFSFWPFLKTIVLSFSVTDKKGNFVKWVGLKMYQRVFTSKTFGLIFKNTWKFAAMVCLGTFIVAMFLALLSASKERGSRLYEVLYALPMAVASAPASSIFVFLMRKENGFINSLFGTNIAWIQDPKWALIAVAFVTVWLGIGSSYIFLLVGFRNVPEELIESAILDGAGPVRRAFSILIPLASPQIFFVVFRVLPAIRENACDRSIRKLGFFIQRDSCRSNDDSVFSVLFHDKRSFINEYQFIGRAVIDVF